MEHIITAGDYDKRVLAEGPQFQANHFYEPVKLSDRRRIDYVLRHVNPQRGEDILDVGCGTGTFSFHCARRGSRVTGVDYSFASVKMAAQLCSRYELPGKVRFAAGNINALPFAGERFGKIVLADVIEHTSREEKDALLSQIKCLLREKGICVVFTPNKVREDIAAWWWRLRSLVTRTKAPSNELHFGLTDKLSFERLLKKHGFLFRISYYDVTRPFLANIPVVRAALALNLLWVISPEEER